MTSFPAPLGPVLRLMALVSLAFIAGCAAPPPAENGWRAVSRDLVEMYGPVQDGDILIPAVPPQYLSERNRRQVVSYWTEQPPGTIVVDPYARFLYLVQGGNTAMRYSIGVGEDGRGFSGVGRIPFKRKWPEWTPTQSMIEEDPELYSPVADGLEGGLNNPLGARALYIFQNGEDTLYRIHGTPYPWTVGQAVSSGCIRMYNQDAIDLYQRVEPGTKVVVLSRAESGQGTVPPEQRMASAGEPVVEMVRD